LRKEAFSARRVSRGELAEESESIKKGRKKENIQKNFAEVDLLPPRGRANKRRAEVTSIKICLNDNPSHRKRPGQGEKGG